MANRPHLTNGLANPSPQTQGIGPASRAPLTRVRLLPGVDDLPCERQLRDGVSPLLHKLFNCFGCPYSGAHQIVGGSAEYSLLGLQGDDRSHQVAAHKHAEPCNDDKAMAMDRACWTIIVGMTICYMQSQ